MSSLYSLLRDGTSQAKSHKFQLRLLDVIPHDDDGIVDLKIISKIFPQTAPIDEW